MLKKQLSITMLKLVLIINLIVGIGAISGVLGYTSVKSKIIIQSVMAQEKTPDKNNVPKWGHEELPENISVDAQLNIKNVIFNCGIIISILVIIYGVIKFILAIRKKDKKKRYKAQKIVVYGLIALVFITFLFFPKSIIL